MRGDKFLRLWIDIRRNLENDIYHFQANSIPIVVLYLFVGLSKMNKTISYAIDFL